MELDSAEQILVYKEQLIQVETALSCTTNCEDRNKLVALKNDIEQLLYLTCEAKPSYTSCSNIKNPIDNALDHEYEQFMAEMRKEGAVTETNIDEAANIKIDKIRALEGTKCKAPHKHSWGDIVYHNALICSIMNSLENNDFEVKVMFINPTHQEMLPCPYYLETDCKFSEDKCRFSHGEIVLFSSLREYTEPNFESITVGSKVLAKRCDSLWYKASIKRLFSEKCIVTFESNGKNEELELCNVWPLNNENVEGDYDTDDLSESGYDDAINMSLVIVPSSEAIGQWETFTKGIGSKLMAKMGYITGNGLGKHSNGILEPVSAVILPPGKSLDHCMKLRESAGGYIEAASPHFEFLRNAKQVLKTMYFGDSNNKKRVPLTIENCIVTLNGMEQIFKGLPRNIRFMKGRTFNQDPQEFFRPDETT
ncbi:hypothetical protein Trydic_g13107 [Trypoxylus dichotomus]